MLSVRLRVIVLCAVGPLIQPISTFHGLILTFNHRKPILLCAARDSLTAGQTAKTSPPDKHDWKKMKINTKGSGHGNFTSGRDNRYWAYEQKQLEILNDALFILSNNVKGMKPCNDCFKKLPGGRSFDEVLNDDSIWINFESRTDRGWYGVTYGVGGKEISISQSAFNKGRWWVAGTLVHEMAHVNGASATTGDADKTLLCCGLKNAYEGAIGMNQSSTKSELV
jgi:hypothetical protein